MEASGTGGLTPLAIDDPQAMMNELSAAEQSCLVEKIGPQRLMSFMSSPELATPEEAQYLVQCLGDEILLRLFVTGLIGQTGSLSEETSMCVRAGLADIDLPAMMLGSMTGTEDDAAAMIAGMAGMFLTLSCLNDEEWEAVAPALEMGRRPGKPAMRAGRVGRAGRTGRIVGSRSGPPDGPLRSRHELRPPNGRRLGPAAGAFRYYIDGIRGRKGEVTPEFGGRAVVTFADMPSFRRKARKDTVTSLETR